MEKFFVNVKYKTGTKVFLVLLGLYTLFFIIGGIGAPILAYFKNFEAAGHLYGILSRSCIQDAVRSFWILGYQMAICARCFGVYIGVLISIILGLFGIRYNKILLIIFPVIGLGEKVMEFLGFAGSNQIRFITGCFLGAFLYIIILLMIKILKGEKDG